ncbi:ABC transporter permease [Rhodovarius sp.]|uniref:ABC transporter permease n=1 Tax=Rhodovarius sp. TaxID=2972673 RepID=UPI003342C8D6
MRQRFLDQMPVIILAILCLGTALMTDRFLSAVNISNVMLQASVMAVVAMGMTYVIISGGFDISVGSTVAAAGCAAAVVMLEFGTGAGVAAGIAVGCLVGLLNGLLVTRLDLNPFIATLGSMVVVRGVVLLLTGGRPIMGEEGLPDAFILYGRARLWGVPLLTWTPIVLFGLLWWVLHRSAYGKRLYATGGNAQAAYLAGINTGRIRASAYVWCGAMAGVAGVMLAARLQSGQPTSGEFYELMAIAAAVVGGASLYGGEGRLAKTIAGVLIIVVLGNALNLMNVDSYWQRIAIGVVIVAAAAADRLRHARRD